jgi:hypothetical protein
MSEQCVFQQALGLEEHGNDLAPKVADGLVSTSTRRRWLGLR